MGVLEATDVVVSFGGNRALDAASVVAAEGRITGLIGPNGAGKTTLLNILSGIVPPDRGSIRLNGRDVTGLPPYRIARSGIGIKTQVPFSLLKKRK